jgi:hypothetical protein
MAGIDLNGYDVSLDAFSVRHAIKEHGDDGRERERGNVAVTADDFGKIQEISTNPDRRQNRTRGKNQRGTKQSASTIRAARHHHVGQKYSHGLTDEAMSMASRCASRRYGAVFIFLSCTLFRNGLQMSPDRMVTGAI